MTTRFVGIGGNDSNNGLSWANRKLTLNGAEDTPVVAGDIVYVGPGTYRELLTVDVSGGNTYSTGTISATNGSAVITGSGTTFSGNVAADYILQVTVLASGTDGVTLAVTATSHTFTSAAGNFQAGHIGHTIRIGTIGAYIITAVASATSITIAKPDNSSFLMVAGVTLTYNVGPEQPYEILSVDSNTQITLKEPWNGSSFTGLAYLTYNPIRYIGDYMGANTDGIGGVVRITGSADDIALTRSNCITGTSKNYRLFSGFLLDGASGNTFTLSTSCSYVILDKMFVQNTGNAGLSFAGTGTAVTVMNSVVFGKGPQICVSYSHSSTVDNCAGLVQNCIILGGNRCIGATRVGGFRVRNCTLLFSITAALGIATALTVGQTETINNCIVSNNNVAFVGTVAGEITSDYNDLMSNGTNYTSTLTGANDKVSIPLFDVRWFFEMVNGGRMITPFDLASYSPLINVAGIYPTSTGARGTTVIGSQREWGALEYDATLLIDKSARARFQIGLG